VATLGLLLLIFALARSRRAHVTPAAVGAYIGAAYFFTSSTSFANPAIAVGRMFSNSFAGIAPASVPGFVAAQLIGGVIAIALVRVLYPNVSDAARVVVIPSSDDDHVATARLEQRRATEHSAARDRRTP
jgi:arsenate reductase